MKVMWILAGATVLLAPTMAADAEMPLARWRGTDLAGGASARFGHAHLGETAVNYVYAVPTGDLARMHADFDLPSVPGERLFLHLYARDDDAPGGCPIEVRVNDTIVFAGPNAFESTAFAWNQWPIPEGALKVGRNRLEIANQAVEGTEGMPPWFMVARAAIGACDCAAEGPPPIEEDMVVRLPEEKRETPEPARDGQRVPGFRIRGIKGWVWRPEQYLAGIPFLAQHKMNFLMNCYGSMFDIEHYLWNSGEANRWWEPLPVEKRAKYEEVVRACRQIGIEFCFCMNPNVASKRILDYDSAQDMDALWQHYAWMAGLGVNWFSISLDDISKGVDAAGQARASNELLRRLRDINPAAQLILCPTYYWGMGEDERYPWDAPGGGRAGAYLAELGEHLHPEVYCFWTGDSVVGPITRPAAESFKARVKHRLFLWDNYPVNDQHPTLHLGPVTSRAADLCEVIDGYMANPMCPQDEISRVPLITQADYAYNPWAYDPARAIGQAIWHLGDTPEQRQALADLVALFPGMLVYRKGPDWNPLVMRFNEILHVPHSRFLADACLDHAEDVATRLDAAFPNRFKDAVLLLRANIETMKAAYAEQYER